MTQGTVSTALVRFMLDSLEQLGADASRLARQVGVPVWALGDDALRVPRVQTARLWELGRHAVGDPHLGLGVSALWIRGRLHLNDYLFETAATLGEGLEVAVRYSHIVADSQGLNDVGVIEDDDRVTFRYQMLSSSGQADAVGSEFALGALLERARRTLGRRVTPLHVGFAARPPRRHGRVMEFFGTDRVDFGAGGSSMTFCRTDLQLPLPGADAALAGILRAHADSVIAAPPRTPHWRDRLRQAVAANLRDQTASLQAVADRLAMSPRTLQRRLAEEGTNWREEVESVRRDQAVRMLSDGTSRAVMAARLGYSDTRSLRRALGRWNIDSA